MTRLDLIDHGDGDYAASVFRAVAAMGAALAPRLPDLVEAIPDSGPSLWQTLCQIENFASAAFTLGESATAKEYVGRARGALAKLGDNYSGSNLREILNTFADRIAWCEEEELLTQIDQIHCSAHRLALRLVQEWGSPRAAEAYLGRMPVTLMVRREQGNRPPMWFDPGAGSIILPIRDSALSLRSYLSLEFMLFHEYTSHVLPASDDPRRLYSDAYMLWLQRLSYSGLIDTPMSAYIVNRHWDNIQKLDELHEEALACAASFHIQCASTKRFPSLLMDLGLEREGGSQFVQHFLSVLGSAHRSKDARYRQEIRKVLRDEANGPIEIRAALDRLMP